MKDLTAQTALKNTVIKKAAPEDVLDVVQEEKIIPLLYIDHHTPLDRKFNLILKRVFDLFISSLALVFLFSWLLPVIALLIKLDSKGPVFFMQKRNKRNGRLFTCIKFRTMTVNADAHTVPAMKDDQRITKIGNFLRIHHLDELPQLLNVWWGDMSVIGPRPHMISDNNRFAQFIKHYDVRHRIKPGITGLAQVEGCVGPVNEAEDVEERITKDLHYIHYWSPALDAKIFFRTFLKMAGIKYK